MQAGQIATLEEARSFLQQQFGIVYQGVSGLSRWCKRHRVKLKTGRRRHAHASEEAQSAFKKITSVLTSARRPRRWRIAPCASSPWMKRVSA